MKNKHMTLDDRIEIQECLTKGMTFKAISEKIGKSRITISREVKLHMHSYSNSFVRTETEKIQKKRLCAETDS